MRDISVDGGRGGRERVTYAAGRGKGAINVEKADGVFHGTFSESRVHACRFGHDETVCGAD